MKPRIIVCGLGRTGYKIFCLLLSAMGNRAIGQVRLFEQLWPIQEEVVDEAHPWLGRKLSDLWDDRSRMLIYYLPKNSRMDLISAVMNDQELQWGDRLIMATKPQVRITHRTLIEKAMGWLSHIRQFQEHVRPTVIVMLVLLSTIVGAALLYTENVSADFIAILRQAGAARGNGCRFCAAISGAKAPYNARLEVARNRVAAG